MNTSRMHFRASAPSGATQPAGAVPVRRPVFSRISRTIGRMVFPAPSIEEAERRMRSRPSFIATMTPEQIAAIDAFDGPEVVGRGGPPRRR